MIRERTRRTRVGNQRPERIVEVEVSGISDPHLDPHRLVIFSRDELKQYELQRKFGDQENLRYLVGDIRDLPRLLRATKGCDVIVHAAAMKQVGACEYNPFEAVQTNVMGAQNVTSAAIDNDVPLTESSPRRPPAEFSYAFLTFGKDESVPQPAGNWSGGQSFDGCGTFSMEWMTPRGPKFLRKFGNSSGSG